MTTKEKIRLFWSWCRMMFAFYVQRKFRNMNWKMVEFLEKSYTPKTSRDARLIKKVLDYNRKNLTPTSTK